MYDEFQKTFPRAHFPRRRALFLAAGDGFKQRMDSFLQSNIRKGTPSLFTMVKPLYTDADKVAAIQACRAALGLDCFVVDPEASVA
jgi:peptide alpha-N-acetyltransferase